MQNLKKNTKQDFSKDFKDFHTLAFMHFHALNEGPLCEFLKIHLSGKPCVMLIRNDDKLIEDNGEILQEKEFQVLGQKFIFKYCVYYTQTLKDLKLPFYTWYSKDERASAMAWYNADYLFYILRHFLPQFKHYFLIDYDAFLNGSYAEYFRLYEGDETDLFLSSFRKEPEDTKWMWLIDTTWIYEPKEWQGCFFSCERISGTALDKFYLRRIEQGQIFAKINQKEQKARWLLCEAFIATEAVNMDFSIKPLLNNKMSLTDIDLNETRLFVLPDNHLYHSVKGQFYKRIADKNSEISRLNNENKALRNEIQGFKTLPVLKQRQELTNLKLDESVKKLEVKKLEKELGMKLSKLELRVNLILSETLRSSAVARVRNHLAYRLGAAIIVCNKSFFGICSLPFVLKFIKAQYKKEQNAYQTLIKQRPELKLPALENYADYEAGLKEKECFTYKLGEAMMRADKTWLSGGYIKFYFEAKKLEKEFKNNKG